MVLNGAGNPTSNQCHDLKTQGQWTTGLLINPLEAS